MNLTLWRKRDPVTHLSPINGGLARLRDEMDRTFERMLQEPLAMVEPKIMRTEGWIPPLDVAETETELTIRAEVPGIATKDLDISVSGGMLTIAGKKEEQDEKKGEDFYQCERRFGSFRRVIDLPETVDPDKITAESDNGVLTIRAAKKPGAKAKHVEVKAASKKVPVGS